MEYLLCSIFHKFFKYMIFQRDKKAFLWSEGLNNSVDRYQVASADLVQHYFQIYRIIKYKVFKILSDWYTY